MATEPDSSSLQVAIVGAGIAGLTTAIALRQQSNINVTIYEQASELKAIGASIGISPNGLRTLEALGLHHVISDENGYRGPAHVPMFYRHWKTNKVIGKDVYENVTESSHHMARFHRAHLHQALLSHVAPDIIHLNTKLLSVTVDAQNGLDLVFSDGTRATADILLGADGLKSHVRNTFVHGYELKWSGLTALRGVFDASVTDAIPDLPKDSAFWWSPTNTFFASRLGKNTFAILGSIPANRKDPQAPLRDIVHWDEAAKVELLRDTYADWHPVVKRLTEVTPEVRYYPIYYGSPLSTWVFEDRVTLIGDAAHPQGGAFGTGGSLAIDDAYAFYLAVNSIYPATSTRKPSPEQIKRALKMYEATRKPHSDRLLKIVHAINMAKAEKMAAGIVETDEQLRARAAKGSNTAWLYEHDVVKAFETVKGTEFPR